MMGDRLGDGETVVSGLFVPPVFILYYNAKAISGLLVTRKLRYYSNLTQESAIIRYQDLVLSASSGIARLFVRQ